MQKHIASPHRTSSRAGLANDLRDRGATDFARWSSASSLASAWRGRARKAAQLIDPGVSVFDVGCGAMALRDYLPDGCRYIPADIVTREAGCIVVDLNSDPYPEVRTNFVTMLGVLEYIVSPRDTLSAARSHHDRMILSYVAHSRGRVESRRALGWLNDLTLDQLLQMLAEAGWSLISQSCIKRRWRTAEYLFSCL